MKRTFLIAFFLVLVLLLGFWSRTQQKPVPGPGLPSPSDPGQITVTETHAISGPKNSSPLLGEVILRDYAKSSLPPQNDLNLLSHLMENSLLLLKSAANRPLSANEDWSDFLKGKNSAHERFLPEAHAALNSNGQLIDRWGTPIFFHALGGGRYEIRSAGPDKIMWTADDLHRNSNGSFRHGTDLEPFALLSSGSKRQVVPGK